MGGHLECRCRAAQTEPVKNQGDAVGHKQVTVALINHDLGLGSALSVVADAARALNRSRSRARTKNSDLGDKPVERGVNRARVRAIKFFNYLIGYLPTFSYIYYFIKTNYITLVHSHWLRTDSCASLAPLLAEGRKGLCSKPYPGPFAIRLGRPWTFDGRSPHVHWMNGAAFNAVAETAREKHWIAACHRRMAVSGLDHSLLAPERYIDPGLKHYSPDRFAVGSSLCTVSRKGQPVLAVCADRKNMQEEARSSS